MPTARPWIVKLGGSLHDAPALRTWLLLLATAPGPPRAIVPGGGPFADAVRAAQARLGFDDGTAHRMALLAMAQFGTLCTGLAPALLGAPSVAAVRTALAAGRVPVWLPLDLLAGHGAIEESWRVTSDSLALWLAGELGAARLVLVKSGALPEAEADAADLAARGLLDAAFPAFAASAGIAIDCVHRDRPERLRAALGSGGTAGIRLGRNPVSPAKTT